MKKITLIGAGIGVIIALIVGIINPLDLSHVVSLNLSFKYLFFLILLHSGGLVLSLIGIPYAFLVIIIEFIMSIFMLISFIINFKWHGFLFLLIFLILFKIIYWFLLVLYGFYSFKYTRNLYTFIFRRYHACRNNTTKYFKKIVVINIFILIWLLLYIIIGKFTLNPLANYLLF